MFDRVLADVPCSGLGLFDAIDENRHRYEAAKNPSSQYQLQYRILLSGARLLRVGGRLVYSTCSLNPDENEGVVSQFLARYPFRLVEIPDIAGIHFRPGLTSWQGCEYGEEMTRARRVTPWENDTQGFFMAVLEKTDELPERLSYPPRATEPVRTLAPDDEAVAPILANIERYYGIDPSAFGALRFLLSARAIYAIDGHWEEIPGGYQRAGICLAKRRGGIWRLSHSMIQRFSDEITRKTIKWRKYAPQAISTLPSPISNRPIRYCATNRLAPWHRSTTWAEAESIGNAHAITNLPAFNARYRDGIPHNRDYLDRCGIGLRRVRRSDVDRPCIRYRS